MRKCADAIRIGRLKLRRVEDAGRLGMVLREALQHDLTTATGHLQIGDHEVIAELGKSPEGLGNATGGVDLKVRSAFTQHSPEPANDSRVVVYQ